ncbi:MAG: Sapep family Mn(2+)-dependent dipeptidase [Lachnospiraceae bacterium]|nr:Sapep family Mn(2+)-dependent dipeptidase [Lachnospiraceae bacterium]
MYRERIDAYIDSKKDEMLSDLALLVRINSQKGAASDGKPFGEGPAAALAEGEALMKKYGLITKNYDNYVVTGDFSEAEKGLDVLAHLDVVPVTEDWKVTQPFEPKIVDGKIYGRGTADDKGPAIAALYALRAIKELGIPMKRSVRLILGSDEECGSSDLAYYYNIEKEAPYSFTPDADFPVINIEKGRLEGSFHAELADGLKLPGIVSAKSGDKANVVPQRARFVVAGLEKSVILEAAEQLNRETGVSFAVEEASAQETVGCPEGASVYAVDVRGQAAHASTPQEGKNALTAMLRLISRLPLAESEGQKVLAALDSLFPYEDVCGKALGIYREDAESGALTLSFSILDYTAEKMSGTFDARLPIGCTEENTKVPVTEKLAACGIVMEDVPMVKPHCVPGDSAFVKTLLGSYERYTGVKGEPLSTGGGTYVHNLERGVAYGCASPEVDNHMHGDDEFMVIDALTMSAKIFADAIIKICNKLD